ncbi:MAG TPA: hypothetical protein DEG86_08045, partial [Halieaceae bacterium]|nr:hypothetical protein [Halieaceae bacterium]
MKSPFVPRPLVTSSALALVLSACGGGGGGDSLVAVNPSPPTGGGGIGGSGQSTTSSGTIDGFGSIFVNGVRYETDDAEVIIDGQVLDDDALRLGMVVLVTGQVDDSGVNGNAERVVYDNELKGPISSIEVSADGDAKLLTILGVNVIVERAGTVFEDVDFDSVSVDDFVEVSGFTGRGDSLRATRLERKDPFVPGQSLVEVRGRVGVVSGSQFAFGDVSVDFSTATLEDFGSVAVSEGQLVEVQGTLAEGLITATRIELDGDPASRFTDGATVQVQGAVTGYLDSASFQVGGVEVDASNAMLQPAGLILANGAVVQINGIWEAGRLLANTVQSRRGRIRVEGPLGAVDAEAGTVTLQLVPGSVTVSIDSATRFDDDTDRSSILRIGDLVPGDFLEVEAYLDGDRLVATTLDRDDDDNEQEIQGPVDSFVAGESVTILGLTYSTTGAEFEGRDDVDISADTFFANVQAGDLVKISDDSIADGIADDVEFEDRVALAGEREFACFGDDDSEDDDETDDSSEGCDDFDDDNPLASDDDLT